MTRRTRMRAQTMLTLMTAMGALVLALPVAEAQTSGGEDPSAAAPLVALPDDDSPETLIYERSFRGAGMQPPAVSDALNLLAAKLLARALPQQQAGAGAGAAVARGTRELTRDEIVWAAETVGVYTPNLLPIVRVFATDKPAEQAQAMLVAELASIVKGSFRRGGYTEAGFAMHWGGAEAYYMLLFAARPVSVTGVPHEEVALGRKVSLRFVVRDGYKNPRLFLTLPSGRVIEEKVKPPRLVGNRFDVDVAMVERGVQRVEVLVEGARGPEVGALVNLYCEMAPPVAPIERLKPTETKRAGEVWLNEPPSGTPSQRVASPNEEVPVLITADDLVREINRLRARVKVGALQVHEGLAQVAEQKVRAMVRDGAVAHRNEGAGGLEERLAQAGLPVEAAAENLAFHHTLTEAHAALLGSPGHRAALFERGYTRVGVSVLPARGGVFVAEIFARPAPKLEDPLAVRKAVFARLDGACSGRFGRDAGGHVVRGGDLTQKAFSESAGLTKLAATHAQASADRKAPAPGDTTRWIAFRARGEAPTAKVEDTRTFVIDPRVSLERQMPGDVPCVSRAAGVGVARSDRTGRTVVLSDDAGAPREVRVAPREDEPFVFHVTVVFGDER